MRLCSLRRAEQTPQQCALTFRSHPLCPSHPPPRPPPARSAAAAGVPPKTLQGNLDPIELFGDDASIRAAAGAMLAGFGAGTPLIGALGGGLSCLTDLHSNQARLLGLAPYLKLANFLSGVIPCLQATWATA